MAVLLSPCLILSSVLGSVDAVWDPCLFFFHWKENHSALPQWDVLLGFSPRDGGSSSGSPWKALGR